MGRGGDIGGGVGEGFKFCMLKHNWWVCYILCQHFSEKKKELTVN